MYNVTADTSPYRSLLPHVVATMHRETLAGWLQREDRNGVWSDDACAAEGMDRPTLGQLYAYLLSEDGADALAWIVARAMGR